VIIVGEKEQEHKGQISRSATHHRSYI